MARIHSEAHATAVSNAGDRIAQNTLYKKDVLSIKDFSLEEIDLVLNTAAELKAKPQNSLLNDKIIANCFFEPSTRTRLSFEAATLKLGGKVIGFSDDSSLSTKKGETLHDTIRVMSGYSDLIVIRHPREGAARLAAEASQVPVINAGDGANQHPTQTLLDLFSIKECQGKLEGLSIALVGDLKYGRTVHSFAEACSLFNIRLFLISPESLSLPDDICDTLKREGVRFSFHTGIEEVMHKVDVVYMTRIQRERMSDGEYQSSKTKCTLTLPMLEKAKSRMRILHPLPRVDEIDTAIDATEHAYYFTQADNGVFVRQALLSLILNEGLS
jgi:aspartate carbamoyltransferase catalytic subunit